jgi:hypothetical protein
MRGHGMGIMLQLPYSAPKHRRHKPIGGIVSATNRALSGHVRIPPAVSLLILVSITRRSNNDAVLEERGLSANVQKFTGFLRPGISIRIG